MNRNLYFGCLVILVFALAFPAAAFSQDNDGEAVLFPLEIRNRTDSPVTVLLSEPEGLAFYALTVGPETDRVFTVREGDYDQTTFACGETTEGTLAVFQQIRLVFTACPGDAPNSGAPSIEKVHLRDAPDGKKWLYQYKPLAPPAPLPDQDGSASGPCEFKATGDITIYRLPDAASAVFATESAGFTTLLDSQTADGWLGFDPGYAQAGNIGPFHSRWIPPDADGNLSGNCSGLPVVWGPPAGVCFVTPFQTSNIYAQPDETSTVAGLLHFGEFAAVLGVSPDDAWAKVDLAPGSTGAQAVGWMDQNVLVFQGACGSLPTVNP
jgi:hypothetical protein